MSDIQRSDVSSNLRRAFNLTGVVQPTLSELVNPVTVVGVDAARPTHAYRLNSATRLLGALAGQFSKLAVLNPAGSGCTMVIEAVVASLRSTAAGRLMAVGYETNLAAYAFDLVGVLDVTDGYRPNQLPTIQAGTVLSATFDLAALIRVEGENRIEATPQWILSPGEAIGCCAGSLAAGDTVAFSVIARVYDWLR